MGVTLQQSVDFNHFESYLALLKTIPNRYAPDEYGRTVLHAIAGMKAESWVSRLLGKKKLPSEFLVELKPFLWSEDDLTAQDSSGDTAVHTAIRHENWHIASVLGWYLYRSPLHDNFRTNHQGMNEYELGIHLYGAAGRAHEMNAVFPHGNRLGQRY